MRPKRPLGLILALLALLFIIAMGLDHAPWRPNRPQAGPENAVQTALGQTLYRQHCASCHGHNLEGQPNWRVRLPNGRLPAPPHDASGHTWHHPDAMLFGITKYGPVPGRFAPPGYESDMPAFGQILSDEEIWAVLAYIKSKWTPETLAHQRKAGQG
ncbi:MAG: c-type cytochrome [Burkholderiales bacterium]